jgi:hypothetical protein
LARVICVVLKGWIWWFSANACGTRTIAGILQQLEAISINMRGDLITSSHFRPSGAKPPPTRCGGNPNVKSHVSYMISALQDDLPFTDFHA